MAARSAAIQPPFLFYSIVTSTADAQHRRERSPADERGLSQYQKERGAMLAGRGLLLIVIVFLPLTDSP
jgi:hypothetical protein